MSVSHRRDNGRLAMRAVAVGADKERRTLLGVERGRSVEHARVMRGARCDGAPPWAGAETAEKRPRSTDARALVARGGGARGIRADGAKRGAFGGMRAVWAMWPGTRTTE